MAILVAIVGFLGPSVTRAMSQTSSSVLLDGTSHLEMGGLGLSSSYTIEGWVRPTAHDNNHRLVDLGLGQAGWWNISLSASDGTTGNPQFRVWNSNVQAWTLSAGAPLPLNTWSHLAGTMGADGRMSLYVNGVLYAQTMVSPLITGGISRTHCFIGRNPGGGPMFNGSIADVRIWNVARTEAQIRASMPVGSVTGPVGNPNLVVAYPFGATGQAPLNDVSGNNRTLLALGSVAFQSAAPSSPWSAPANDVLVAELNGQGSFTAALGATSSVPLTLEGWVRPRSHAASARIVDVGNTNNRVMLLASTGTNGRPALSVLVGGTNVLNLSPTNVLPLNVWSHVSALLGSDRSAQVYLNGLLVASGTATAVTNAIVSATALVGASSVAGDALLDGALGEVRIWNAARTQGQIQASMAVGSVTGPVPGLMAAYPFGNTGQESLADVSGNQRTLVPSGTVPVRTTAPAFPNESSVRLADLHSLTVPSIPASGNDYTVEAWVNQRSINNNDVVVELGSGAVSSRIQLVLAGGRPNLWLTTSQGSGAGSAAATNSIPLNVWTHLAGVVSADRTMRLYVNGQLVASSVASIQAPNVVRSQNAIGGTPSTGNSWTSFNGSIADVRIWAAARTEAEIRASMAVGSVSGAVTNLLAAYPFGATGQAPLNDVSGNNRTLSYNGASAFFQVPGPSSPPAAAPDGFLSARMGGTNTYFTASAPAVATDLTVEGWVFPTSHESDAPLVQFGNATNNVQLLASMGTTGRPRFIINAGGNNALILTANAAIPLNTWSYLSAWVQNDRNAYLFVNGLWYGPGTATSLPSIPASATNLTIGGNRWGGPSIAGRIADVRVWDIARSLNQIRAAMPPGSIGGPAFGLVAAYPFGTTGAGVLADVSGSGADLTPVGASEFVKSGGGLAMAMGFQGAAAVSVQGGRLTLSGASTHSGGTTVGTNAILQVGTGGTAGSLGTGPLVNHGALVFDRSGSDTMATAISGSGTVTLRGGATLALTGNNTYSGGTRVEAGVLQVGDGGTSGTLGTGAVSNNAVVVFNRADDVTLNAEISGTGSVRKLGAGRLSVEARQGYSGGTTIGGGTLALTGIGTVGSGPIRVGGGATLDVVGRTAGLVLGAGQTVGNEGGTGTLRGTVDATAGGLVLVAEGAEPPLTVAEGTLTVAGGTGLRISKAGAPLPAGTHRMVGRSGEGRVVGVAPSAFELEGAGAEGGLDLSTLLGDGELLFKAGSPATVTLGNLAQTYDGTARVATATTEPAGLPVRVTYNGSTTPPTNGGTYAVVATVMDAVRSGTATGTLVVARARASIQLGNLQQSYSGSARRPLATTEPAGLAWAATFNGSSNAPVNVGSYAVVADITDVNYTGTASGTFVIRQADPSLRPLANERPPFHLNHQGYLVDDSGTPLGSPNPRNYDLVFRVFGSATGGSALWAERQTVTVDQGRYSVTLGDGESHGVEPWHHLDFVMMSGPGTGRYLEVSMRGTGLGGTDVPLPPRFQMVSQPYAFLAGHARTADTVVGGDGGAVLRVSGESVGIQVEQPNASLDVGGTVTTTTLGGSGTGTLSGVMTAGRFVGRGTIPLGGIVVWAGSEPPAGWALCDGREAMGRRTPDLRGRFVVGSGQGSGLTGRTTGQVGGAETHALTDGEMAEHAHVFDPPAADTTPGGAHSHEYATNAIDQWPGARPWGGYEGGYSGTHAGVTTMGGGGASPHRHPVSFTATATSVGTGQAHPSLPPYYALAYIMRVQ